MVLKIFSAAAAAALVLGCTSVERDNPLDAKGIYDQIACADESTIDVANTLHDLCIEGASKNINCDELMFVKIDACPSGFVFKCIYDDAVLKLYGSIWEPSDAYDFCEDDYNCSCEINYEYSSPSRSSSSYSSSSYYSSSSRPSSSSSARSSSSFSSSSRSIEKVYGASVTYQGETYQTVVIGTQTWFARNLNYDVEGSKCFSNQDSYCETYGRLYDWATAMAFESSCNYNYCSSMIQAKHQGICPTGWHIPTNDEWNTLSSYVQNDSGCSSCDGTLLKATDGWYSNGNGTDAYGFAALPGGYGYSGGHFSTAGYYGFWRGASEINDDYAYGRYMAYYGERAYWDDSKPNLFSVRCVQD